MMIDVPVVEATTDSAVQISPTTSIAEAAGLLRDPDVPALLVTDGSTVIVGVVTGSDVVAAVDRGIVEEDVTACMSTPVVTVGPETTVGLAADRMRDAGVSLLPVVTDDGEYLGLATSDTLAPHVSRHRLDVTWEGDPIRVDDDRVDAT